MRLVWDSNPQPRVRNTTRLTGPTEIEHLKTVLKLLRNCLKLYI